MFSYAVWFGWVSILPLLARSSWTDMIETRSRTRLQGGSREIATFSPSSWTGSYRGGIPYHQRSSFSLHL
jgi:hypothetical protein